MSLTVKRTMLRVMMFGMLGLVFEIFLGATLRAWRGDWNLHGRSSVWMMLDYGLIGVLLMPIARPLHRRRIPLVMRAFVYMLAIYIVEFVSGWLFEMAGLRIWDNSHLPYNLCGYVALHYAPVWYAIGLVAEWLYVRVDACALVLARGLTATDLTNATERSLGSANLSN